MNKPYILSNVTPEVFFRHHCTDENAIEFYEKSLEDLKALDFEYAGYAKSLELAEEQVYFAKNLIKEIKEALNSCTTAKDLKRDIKLALSDSMFED